MGDTTDSRHDECINWKNSRAGTSNRQRRNCEKRGSFARGVVPPKKGATKGGVPSIRVSDLMRKMENRVTEVG